MALIRQAESTPHLRDAIVLDFGDLAAHAEEARKKAKAQAQVIIDQAAKERERLLLDASVVGHAKGFEEGRREGLEKGHAEGRTAAMREYQSRLDAITKSWTRVLESFQAERKQLWSDAHNDVVRLALTIAERIVKRSLDLDPTIAASQAQAALGLLASRATVKLLINPEDQEVVSSAIPAILASLGASHDIELVLDSSVSRGGCVLRTPVGGEIDAGISTQVDRIRDVLLPASEPAEGA
jgi:flagellar assembly protein FliH